MHYETVLKPLVFATELQNGKYYVTMTRNLNETLAKWRGGEGPLWVREHGFRRVVEVEAEGNKHSLYLMVLMYIDSFGESNVRSSVVGHSAEHHMVVKGALPSGVCGASAFPRDEGHVLPGGVPPPCGGALRYPA